MKKEEDVIFSEHWAALALIAALAGWSMVVDAPVETRSEIHGP